MRVPTYKKQVDRSAIPQVRANSEAPISAFGPDYQGITREAQGLVGDAKKSYDIAKRRADDAAVQAAKAKLTDGKNDLFWNPKDGAFTKRGQNAAGVIDEYTPKFQKLAKGIRDGLNGDEQKAMFDHLATDEGSDFNYGLMRHTFAEDKEFKKGAATSLIASLGNDCIKNWPIGGIQANGTLDEKGPIAKNIRLALGASRQLSADEGLSKEQADMRDQGVASGIHFGIIDGMITQGSGDTARKYFAAQKDSMSPEDVNKVNERLKTEDTLEKSYGVWNGVKGLRLTDGEPDETKMFAHVMALPGEDATSKQHIWEYVKGRIGEDVTSRNRADQARDKQFTDEANGTQKSGGDLASVLRIAQRYSRDPTDQAAKEKYARDMFAAPTKSDPQTFISLWQGIQDGNAKQRNIDSAFSAGGLNAADWRTLREDLYKSNTEGSSNPAVKAAWERVGILADEKFSKNKVGKEQFIYTMHQELNGRTPEEIQKVATDKLANGPRGHWSLMGLADIPNIRRGDQLWKADLQRIDSNNIAWGKAYQDIGEPQILAIGEGMKKKTWGLTDVNAFAEAMGGYDKIKPGTPAHNAMNSLLRRDAMVTAANVNAVLASHPDGNY